MPMILIFAPKITNRVGYTFNLIFDRILNCNFKLTDDRELFANHPGAKICYNGDRLCDDCIFIKSSPLLFQYNIENVEPECFEFDDGTFSEFTHSNRLKAIFPVHDSESDLEFDIFAASFYLASRYEEYPTSSHGTGECFEYKKSIACRNGFLEYPVINMWCEILKSLISGKFPEFEWHRKKFEHIATINISTPFKYKEIGHVRTIAGMLRDIESTNLYCHACAPFSANRPTHTTTTTKYCLFRGNTTARHCFSVRQATFLTTTSQLPTHGAVSVCCCGTSPITARSAICFHTTLTTVPTLCRWKRNGFRAYSTSP